MFSDGHVVLLRDTLSAVTLRYLVTAPAFGFPGRDGSFQLTAFKLNDGLAPGTYKVVIAPKEEGEPRGSNAASIPKTYQSRDTSPLQIEIKAEETTLEPFVLK